MSFARRLARRGTAPPLLDVEDAVTFVDAFPHYASVLEHASLTHVRPLYDRACLERDAFRRGDLSKATFLRTATSLHTWTQLALGTSTPLR